MVFVVRIERSGETSSRLSTYIDSLDDFFINLRIYMYILIKYIILSYTYYTTPLFTNFFISLYILHTLGARSIFHSEEINKVYSSEENDINNNSKFSGKFKK